MNIDAGSTAWVLVAAALVLFMTPGLAFFYGGMVRAKHVLAMLMLNFICMGVVTIVWAIVGYSLGFGGTHSWIGNLDFGAMRDVASQAPPGLSLVIPPSAYFAFQMMFAVITPALIAGAVADRIRFGAWVWFVIIWSVVVYSPVAHWVFAPAGWAFQLGALDFAGGAVIHINAGVAALAFVLLLGRRRGWPDRPMPPHSLPLTLLGAGVLWFGWFGFNAGSALAADGVAAQALVNTHLAAAAGMVGWLVVERLRTGHATTLGAASGAVAGLVAITPCAGYVGGLAPLCIGAIAGAVCVLAVTLKNRFGYDDSLDVVGVHLVGGIIGTVLLGLFADKAINPAMTESGLFFGGGLPLLGKQVLVAGVVLVYSFVVTFVIVWVLKRALPGGIRVTETDEEQGLDVTQHSETGYAFSN